MNYNISDGKIPPQARELEDAVLGAILIEKSAYDIVSELLSPECFYVEANAKIFNACRSLAAKSQPIDLLTVVQELKLSGELEAVGGPYYVTKTTSSVVSSANIESHASIILETFIKREVIRLGADLIAGGYSELTESREIIEKHEKQLTSLSGHTNEHVETLSNALVRSLQRIEGLKKQNRHITGIPTGFEDLDRITHGWQDTDLIILAARPSVGKTAFALNLARNAAFNDIKPVCVVIFSLEMSTGQLVNRLISAESGIYLDNISNGTIDDEQMNTLLKKAIYPLSEKKMFIDDTAALTIGELKSKARKLKRKHNIGLIIVDYIQLMNGSEQNREREIATISRGLKQLAKELTLPIIALSQLSRETEKRNDKTPKLSDLRESGAIEQDADMVMFMYRPEYYGEVSNEFGETNKGLTKIEIKKHRNGCLAIGDDAIKLKASLEIQKFTKWESGSVPMPANWKPIKQDTFSPF